MKVAVLLLCGAGWIFAQAQPQASRVSRQLIGELVAAGKAGEAENVLRDAIAKEPDSAELHAQLGMLHYELKNYDAAIAALGRAVQLDEANAEFSLNLADVLLTARKFSVAVEYLVALKGRFGSLPRFQYNLGLAYYGARNFATALDHFRVAARRAPKLALARYFEGNCLAAMGRLPDAQQAYRDALKLEPRQPDYLFALGKILSLSGPEHDPETIAMLKLALAAKPDHYPSKFYLALAYERTGRLPDAMDLLEAIVRAYPDQLEPHAALARIYYRLKLRDKGDEAARTVRKLRESGQNGAPTASPF